MFKRFPHRNQAMGRLDTPEEEKYLKTADGWGQAKYSALLNVYREMQEADQDKIW